MRRGIVACSIFFTACHEAASHPPVDGTPGAPIGAVGGGTSMDAAIADAGDAGAANPFPDAANTGATAARCGVLENATARDLLPADAGIVIEKKRFTEGFRIQARNVTLRCCEIVGTATTALVEATAGTGDAPDGLLIEDTTIHGPSADVATAAGLVVDASNVTIRRTNVSFATLGIRLDGDSILVEDSVVHDLVGGGSEPAALVVRRGRARVAVRHNTLLDPVGSGNALALRHLDHPDDPVSASRYASVVVDGNLLAGGRYTLDTGGVVDGVVFPADGVVFSNNAFSVTFFSASGSSGPVFGYPPEGYGYSWQNNGWLDGPKAGGAIAPQ